MLFAACGLLRIDVECKAIPPNLKGRYMNKFYFDMNTLRLSLSGALLGMAIVGLLFHADYLQGIGAVVGGAAVWFAKYRHIF